MIKRYCDVCKKEIDQYTDRVKPFYGVRAWELDMCLDCRDKWEEFRGTLHKKYDKLYSDLQKQEQKEVCDFLGIEEDEFHKDRREEELDD